MYMNMRVIYTCTYGVYTQNNGAHQCANLPPPLQQTLRSQQLHYYHPWSNSSWSLAHLYALLSVLMMPSLRDML